MVEARTTGGHNHLIVEAWLIAMHARGMGYKTRSDKKYCDKKRTKMHYYEMVTKHPREARRARRKAVGR